MCYIVGSDLEGKLVPSSEIVVRLLEAEHPRNATSAAALAIHVLEEHTPQVQQPFLPKEGPLASRGPSFDGAALTFLSADRDPAAGSPRCMRYEVKIPQRTVRVDEVSDTMGKDCAVAGHP